MIYSRHRHALEREQEEGLQPRIPSIQNSLWLVLFNETPPPPPVRPTPLSGALISVAPVTSFYQKGLQLLLPHYDQNYSFSLTAGGGGGSPWD